MPVSYQPELFKSFYFWHTIYLCREMKIAICAAFFFQILQKNSLRDIIHLITVVGPVGPPTSQ